MPEDKVTIEQLAEALENTKGRTPLEVLDAFCPHGAKVGPFALVPLTAGHDLFLTRVKHPLGLGAGAAWGPSDVAMALFAFTRPSRELFRMVEDGTLQDELHAFLDDIPIGGIEGAAADLISHWIRSRASAVPLVAPDSHAGSKKKPDLVGGSAP